MLAQLVFPDVKLASAHVQHTCTLTVAYPIVVVSLQAYACAFTLNTVILVEACHKSKMKVHRQQLACIIMYYVE